MIQPTNPTLHTPAFRARLHDTLARSASLAPDKVAIWAGHRSCTYRELAEGSNRIAAELQRFGISPPTRVGLYLENSIETAFAVYGVLKAGATLVVINPQTKPEKLGYIIRDCGISAVICDAHLTSAALDVASESPSVRLVVTNGAAFELPQHGIPIVQLTEILRGASDDPRDPGTIPSDLAALIYTSGSTGTPKGVMQTHQSMVFALNSIIEYLRLDADDVILNVLPLAFDYGLYQLLMTVALGATLVLERSFAFPGEVLSRIEEHGVTVFPGVPTIHALLIGAHRKRALQYPGIKRVTNTAAALPPQHVSQLREIFPNALIYCMYGLTECKRVSYLPPEWLDLKPGSVGIPIPGTAVYLRSPEGNEVAIGERGILHVRGPHLMSGYWNSPERTARMLIAGESLGELVLRTGDWFRMDADGCLYFEGRSDDIIKTRGEKVSPAEVEYALCSIPGVLEAAVIGVHDELLGEAVKAFIVPAADSALDERRLRREASARIEAFMVPRDIEFLDALPKTENGKVDRRKLSGP